MEKVLLTAAGFVGVVLYASKKLDENPNKIFKATGEDINSAIKVVKEKVSNIKAQANSNTKDE